MLRVRIAELNRSQLRRMGVDMQFLLDSGRHAITTIAGGLPANIAGIFENGEISVLIDWLALNGTAPADSVSDALKFYGDMRKATLNGEQMFDSAKGQDISTRLGPGGTVVNWSFGLELKRTEGE